MNKEELFNLCHASACNVIECIFGVIKRRFRILLLAPEYGLDVQAQIPTALCAIHNFIQIHDADEADVLRDSSYTANYDSGEDPPMMVVTGTDGQEGSDERRGCIAQAMWEDYQQICAERGIGNSVDETDLSDNDELEEMYD